MKYRLLIALYLFATSAVEANDRLDGIYLAKSCAVSEQNSTGEWTCTKPTSDILKISTNSSGVTSVNIQTHTPGGGGCIFEGQLKKVGKQYTAIGKGKFSENICKIDFIMQSNSSLTLQEGIDSDCYNAAICGYGDSLFNDEVYNKKNH